MAAKSGSGAAAKKAGAKPAPAKARSTTPSKAKAPVAAKAAAPAKKEAAAKPAAAKVSKPAAPVASAQPAAVAAAPAVPAQPVAGAQPAAANPGAPARPHPVLLKIVAEMQKVPGMVAVGLGGSRSIGMATPGSDYDVIMFSEPDPKLDVDAMRHAVARLGGRWMTRGQRGLAEAEIDGQKVELLFRQIDKIAAEIARAKQGQIRRSLNPLHTVGFLSTILVSYATYVRPLWDPEGRLRRLIQSAFPYPQALQAKMLHTFRTEAKLALMHCAKTRSAHDVAHLMGLYSRAHAAWTLALFALNRRYPIIDKGGRHLVTTFPLCPENFTPRSKTIFRAAATGDLKGALDEANKIDDEIALMVRAERAKLGAGRAAKPAQQPAEQPA